MLNFVTTPLDSFSVSRTETQRNSLRSMQGLGSKARTWLPCDFMTDERGTGDIKKQVALHHEPMFSILFHLYRGVQANLEGFCLDWPLGRGVKTR